MSAMTTPRPLDRPFPGAVIEADYLVVDPPASRAAKASPRPLAVAAPDLSALLPPPARKGKPPTRRGGAAFWTGGLALVALSFWVSGGHALILPALMETAERHQSGELTLSVLSSGIRYEGGRPVFAVETEIANLRDEARVVPPVTILIVSGGGSTMRYSPTSPGGKIPGGTRQRFSSRLPVPAGGVRSVSVAFSS